MPSFHLGIQVSAEQSMTLSRQWVVQSMCFCRTDGWPWLGHSLLKPWSLSIDLNEQESNKSKEMENCHWHLCFFLSRLQISGHVVWHLSNDPLTLRTVIIIHMSLALPYACFCQIRSFWYIIWNKTNEVSKCRWELFICQSWTQLNQQIYWIMKANFERKKIVPNTVSQCFQLLLYSLLFRYLGVNI